MYGFVQEASTSRAAGGYSRPRGHPNVERPRAGNAPRRPPHPQLRTARTSQLIALKDGDPISFGYTYVVDGLTDLLSSCKIQLRNACDTVDLSTPAKATQPATVEAPDTAKSKANKKTNGTFAKEIKDLSATGRPMAIRVAVEHSDLKGT